MVKRLAGKVAKATKKAKKAIRKADPKAKFKAKRTLRKDVEEKLKAQSAVKRDAPATKPSGGPAFKQTTRERAADKAKKPADNRVQSAGANLTAAQTKRITDAPTPIALTSLQNTMVKEIDALKSISTDQKTARKKSLRSAIADQKEVLRKRAETPAKKPKPKDPDKTKQTFKERARASFGKVRTIGTTQRNKKEGLGMMTSYTSMTRADAIVKAGKDLRADKITQSQYDDIMKAIDKKDTAEVMMGKARASAGRKRKVKPLPVTAEDFAKLKKNRGGLMKTGHRDMRKGGLFK